MLQGGVEQAQLVWRAYDGIGRGGPQRAQLHRTRLRRPRRRRLLRPRAHRRLAAAAGRRRLGADLRRGRRPLVPHGRRLLRPLGDDAGASPSRPSRLRAATAPSSPTTSTTGRRCGRSRGGADAAAAVNRELVRARRRPLRQRGGLLGRRSGIRWRGVTRTSSSSTSANYERLLGRVLDGSAAGRARRLDPAQSAHRDAERLGRGLPDARRFHVGPSFEGSRSSTASAAATRSPPGSSTGCSSSSTSIRRSPTAWRTGRLR